MCLRKPVNVCCCSSEREVTHVYTYTHIYIYVYLYVCVLSRVYGVVYVDNGSHNVSRWMTWLPISLKNAVKCDKWYQLQNHSITESLNANGAWEKLFWVIPVHAIFSVSNKKQHTHTYAHIYICTSLCIFVYVYACGLHTCWRWAKCCVGCGECVKMCACVCLSLSTLYINTVFSGVCEARDTHARAHALFICTCIYIYYYVCMHVYYI